MATTERDIRSYLDGEVSLQLSTPDMRVALSDRSRPDLHHIQLRLTACSRCLRVLRDERWVRAETVIRDLSTFDHDLPPSFEAVLCPLCAFSIHLRRADGRGSPRRHNVRSRRRHQLRRSHARILDLTKGVHSSVAVPGKDVAPATGAPRGSEPHHG